MRASVPWLPQSRGPISIRELRESDLARLYDLESDPFLKRFINGGRIEKPRDEWLERAKRRSPSDITFVIEDVATGGFAGRASLGHYLRYGNPAHREAQVVLDKPYLGKHLGREVTMLLCTIAFDFLEAETVFGVVHPEHEPSLRLMDALRFSEVAPEVSAARVIEARVFELARGGPN